MAQAIARDITYTGRSGTVTIVGLFDVHWGCKACATKAVHEAVQRIKNTPNCY